MAGIELGSFEFKSKSSNRWAVEATDESCHIIAQSVLLPITILYKETDRKKLEGTIWNIDFNRKSIYFTSLGPFDACQLLMVTFWQDFFSVCGVSRFLQSGGGP